MAIIVNLDVMLAKRKMRLNDLAAAVDITPPNLSVLKSGRARAIRFSTLNAICRVLECQPGDLLEFRSGGEIEGGGEPTEGGLPEPSGGSGG